MSVTLVLPQGVPRLDNFAAQVTLEPRVVEVEPFHVSCDVSLALRDFSTHATVPRFVLIFPHHSAYPSLQCRHQF